MKKIIAILLAVMMLGSVTAFADNAPVFTLSDPIVTVETPDSPMTTIDLTGLALAISPIVEGEEVTVALNVLAQGQPALVAAAKVVDGSRVLLGMNGLSHTYYVDMPVEQMTASTQVDLSGIDTDALVQQIMSEATITSEGGTVNFSLPYTAVNSVLESLMPTIAEAVAAQGVDTSEFEGLVAQLKQSDSGVNLEGSFTQSETGASGVLNVIPVQNGQAAPAPVAVVNGQYGQSGEGMSADFSISAAMDGANLSEMVKVHVMVGSEVPNVQLDIEVPAAGAAFNFFYDAAASTISLNIAASGTTVMLNATVGVSEGELAVCPLDAANAVNIETLSEEETEQLGNEAMQAVAPLMSVVSQALGQ